MVTLTGRPEDQLTWRGMQILLQGKTRAQRDPGPWSIQLASMTLIFFDHWLSCEVYICQTTAHVEVIA